MSAEHLSRLSFEEKKALLAKLLKKKPRNASTDQSFIELSPRNQPIPTSVIQKEIWLHEQLVADSNAYNIPIALEITGNFNSRALEQAFQAVIKKYEILRTSFYTIDGIPFQKIEPEIDFKIDIVKLDPPPLEMQEQLLVDTLFRFSKKSFVLDEAPLFRVLTIELGSNKYVVAFVIHHLLCDNWSLTLLIQEILALFNSLSEGKITDTSPPPYQFADYAFWEQKMLASDEAKNKIEHLKEKLRKLNFELKLPYDYPRNFEERATAKSKQFTFDKSVSKNISQVCSLKQITPYVFFLTIYHILIYKYTFQDNIVIGTSFLNRPGDEQEGLIGPFINVALIDSNIGTGSTFISLANQIKANVLEMHSYRFIPINKMIKTMKAFTRKEISLAQAFYGFLNFKVSQIPHHTSQQLSVKLLNQSNELRVYNSAKFELDLTMWEDENQMGGSLEYMNNVFADGTIDLLIDHFNQLCNQFCNNPELLLSAVRLSNRKSSNSLLTEDEAAFTFS